jgi:hypothetical protein
MNGALVIAEPKLRCGFGHDWISDVLAVALATQVKISDLVGVLANLSTLFFAKLFENLLQLHQVISVVIMFCVFGFNRHLYFHSNNIAKSVFRADNTFATIARVMDH